MKVGFIFITVLYSISQLARKVMMFFPLAAINSLSSLINDVKAATYKTMPATLAKAPPANAQQQQQQRK